MYTKRMNHRPGMHTALCALIFFYSSLGCSGPANTGNQNTNDNTGPAQTNDNSSGQIPNDPNNDDPDATDLNLVNTGIALHAMSRVEVGNDLIAFTYPAPAGNPGGVGYIIPSEKDTERRDIPGIDPKIAYNSFCVSGYKIVLVSGAASETAYQVSIYDTADPKTPPVMIPVDEIRLGTIPVGISDPGHIQCDGDYVVVRNDSTPLVKLIDISKTEPVVIPLSMDPGSASSAFNIPQVLVDAESRTAVASTDDAFYVYDIDHPNAEPVEFAMESHGIDGIGNDYQFKMDEGVILFRDDALPDNMYLLDITDASNEPVLVGPTEGFDPEILGEHYGFLSNEGPISADSASAVGRIDEDAAVADDTTILTGSANWGHYGQGGSIAIGQWNDDVVWFVMGPLQWSRSGGGASAWNVVYDPDDPEIPLFGSRVTTNADGSLLAFFWGRNNSTLGYAILN